MIKKYQIDTAENKEFLKEMRDQLLSFGHNFPSPGGGSYYLGHEGSADSIQQSGCIYCHGGKRSLWCVKGGADDGKNIRCGSFRGAFD